MTGTFSQREVAPYSPHDNMFHELTEFLSATATKYQKKQIPSDDIVAVIGRAVGYLIARANCTETDKAVLVQVAILNVSKGMDDFNKEKTSVN